MGEVVDEYVRRGRKLPVDNFNKGTGIGEGLPSHLRESAGPNGTASLIVQLSGSWWGLVQWKPINGSCWE
jgi:hypothetical protein